MSTEWLAMQEWESAVRHSLEHTVVALGCPAPHAGPPGVATGCGAYIPLLSVNDSLRFGVMTTPEGCESIARWLTGIEEAMDPSDVADAMCEFVNIMAGSLKQTVDSKLPGLRVGLPLFVAGKVRSPSNLESSLQTLWVGEVELTLAVTRHRHEGN